MRDLPFAALWQDLTPAERRLVIRAAGGDLRRMHALARLRNRLRPTEPAQRRVGRPDDSRWRFVRYLVRCGRLNEGHGAAEDSGR